MSTWLFLRRRDGLLVRNTQGEFIKAKICCFSRVPEAMALLEFFTLDALISMKQEGDGIKFNFYRFFLKDFLFR
jgi:hypothetical protein